MKIILQRVQEDEFGTHGILYSEQHQILCHTLEPQWKNNQNNISCILPGVYSVIPNNIEKPWRLLDVPGRTQVDIHAGNFISDTEGCILVGLSPAHNGVLQSQLAIDKLRGILPENFQIEILPVSG